MVCKTKKERHHKEGTTEKSHLTVLIGGFLAMTKPCCVTSNHKLSAGSAKAYSVFNGMHIVMVVWFGRQEQPCGQNFYWFVFSNDRTGVTVFRFFERYDANQ